MAALVTRPVSFPEMGGSEQEQDPNSALLELDRGLKSSQVGEQCEAITRFPALFEKYPFPILINSALLKLAEVFRQETPGSNFVRVCVVEIIETCGKHLDKLINVEEFLRRITAVMHSNDPMARALTLRTLGWMSVVVGENRQAHHLIREALDAKDPVELQAAIFAAEKYAARSKSFAMNMCERLTSMISGLATPMDVKLQLIKIFQHMYHDVETASTVRELCLKLLQEYPTQRVVVRTLHTLTELAAHSLVDIPQQVDLLMEYLGSEPRLGIRWAVLEELISLSEAAPRAWTSQNLKALIRFADSSLSDVPVVCRALSILARLISSPEFTQVDTDSKKSLVSLSRKCMYNTDLKVAANGVNLFTNIILSSFSEENKTLQIEEALDTGINVVHCIIASTSQEKLHSFMALALKCVGDLANADESNCHHVFPCLIDALNNESLSDRNAQLICRSLTSLGSSHASALHGNIDKLITLIHRLAATSKILSPRQTDTMFSITTLVFQAFHCHKWLKQGEHAVSLSSKSVNLWTAYRIARQASRYGHHDFAHSVYDNLSSKVCSDQQHFWLRALSLFSLGEAKVAYTEEYRSDDLLVANSHLNQALSSLKAASSVTTPLSFPSEFLTLRAESMVCHAQLSHAALSLRTAPPPAIAAALVTSSCGRDDLLRCGRVGQQLNKSLRDFTQLSSNYGKLYQSSFDADPTTLCNVSLLQEGANLMAKAIEAVIQPSSSNGLQIQPDLTAITKKLGTKKVIEIQSLVDGIEQASLLIEKLLKVCEEIKPIREQHLHLLQDISQTLTGVPHPYPRFFFQRIQQTTITLNLSPQPRTPSDPLCVTTTGQLAIKVEGVIVHGRHSGLFRNVKTVTLAVCSTIQNRPALDTKFEPNESLSQTVTPHNDFFTAHFLLGFPVAGMYQVTVEASVTDAEDDGWQTGPSLSQSVKALEDPASKQPVAPQARSQFPNLSPTPRLPLAASSSGSVGEPFVANVNQAPQFPAPRNIL